MQLAIIRLGPARQFDSREDQLYGRGANTIGHKPDLEPSSQLSIIAAALSKWNKLNLHPSEKVKQAESA